jgi:ATP-dependent metalloprotease FtsH
MDGKGGNDWPGWHGRSRKQKSVWNILKDRKRIVKFFQTRRSTLIAVFLLAAIMVLLFGIVSQFQSPSTEDIPGGQTAINYSTFVAQINANNVLAVIIRDNEVSALLLHSADTKTGASLSAAQKSAQIATWSSYIDSDGSTGWGLQTPGNLAPGRLVSTTLPAGGLDQLMPLLMNKDVLVSTQAPAETPAWLGILLKFAPLLFLLLLVVMVLKPRTKGRIPQNVNEHIAQFTKKQRVRRFDSAAITKPRDGMNGQNSQKPGKPASSAFTPAGSASQQPLKLPPSTTFADVAGIDEVSAELEEIVQFLRFPEKYDRLGARIPRGALLVGQPGTGKTLLARAVAGEAGVPFFSISASEFVEMFVGVGASRVRDLFAQARQAAPAVIFIDEIDAVGRKRSMKAMGNEERDQTLNQLLVELDGFDGRQAVVVLAATNRVDILDKALLRPGRFDRHVNVSLPDRVGRQAILQIHTSKTPLHESVSLERLARLTTGMSGADLANVVNEAALCAARQDFEHLTHECFEDALARVQLGAIRPLIMNEADRRIIAYHESGHALVAHYLHDADTVNRVTILPRGQSLGVTQFIAEEDRYNYSREMLMAKIAVGLGGRSAEELTLGRERVTTGAENDFQVVTSMARRMVTRWGMSDEVGVVFTDYDEGGAGLNMCRLDPPAFASHSRTMALDATGQLVSNGQPALARQSAFALATPVAGSAKNIGMIGLVDREVKKILDEGHEMAQRILQEHFDQLERLADALMEREQLSRAEFESLMQA